MIYGYARCSTNEKLQDIERQVRELKRQGATDETIYKEYESGTKTNRTELKKLLNAVDTGDTIIATEISRFTRSTKQLCEIIEFVKENHIKLVLGTFIVDCSRELDPMTEGMLKMMGVFAELERNMITVDGWSVENNPPILFERFNHQKGQVLPKENGDINKIFDYINLKEDHVLFLCWMVSCFVPEIPHAISIIYGEKGAAKSTACEILKMLIDPSVLEHMTLENDQRTLVINLTNHWYLPFDNVSVISSSTSDMLCRAVTGGGVQQRKLCTNAEDYVFKFKRCLSINGINNVATRADLLDRSILFELKRISGKDRKEIREVYENFEKDRESILGGIFDVLSKAMRLYDSVKLESLPRMADFARWGYAIGEALGGYGTEFLDEYRKNQQSRNYEIINLDIVGWLIVQFMEERECWSGYAQELFNQLKEIAERNGIDFRSSEMPKQPNGLTRRMGAIKSNLEDVGISYVKKTDAKGTRIDIKNSNISPLPPYAESVGDIGENSNGDNNGDKFSEKVLPPYENIRNNGADGENGDICPDNQ